MSQDKNWDGPCSSKSASRIRNLDYRIKKEKDKSERSPICPILAKTDCVLNLGGFDEAWLRYYDEKCCIFMPENTIKLPKHWSILADGTFATSSNLFSQHYILLQVEEREAEENISPIAQVRIKV